MNVARCPSDRESLIWAWGHAFRFLEAPLEIAGNKYSLDDVFDCLVNRSNDYHLWLIEDAGTIIGACVTNFVRYPRKLFTNVWLVGGTRFNEWVHVLAENVFRMSRECGCDGVELCGRKGWLRVFQKYSVRSLVAMECGL